MMRRWRYPNLRNGLVGAWCPSIDFSFSDRATNFAQNIAGYDYLDTLGSAKPARSLVDGKIALKFDGSSSKGYLYGLRPRSWAGPVSFSFWQNIDAGHTGSVFGVSSSTINPDSRINCHGCWTDNNIYFDYGSSTGNGRISAAYGNYLGKMTHVCLTSGGQLNTGRAIYINGVLVASSANSDYLSDQNDFAVGIWYNGSIAASYYHNGSVDDFSIYDRALSPAQIKQLSLRRGIAHETYRVPVVRGATVAGGINAVVSLTLDGVTGSAAAQVHVTAGVTATLDGAVATGAVVSPISAGVTATLDGASASSTAIAPIAGLVSATLDGVTGSATVTSGINTSVSATLDGVTNSGAITAAISAGVTATLEGVSVAGTVVVGSPPLSASVSATLDGVVAQSTTVSLISAGVTASLDGAIALSTVTALLAAGVTATLDGVTVSAIVGEPSAFNPAWAEDVSVLIA